MELPPFISTVLYPGRPVILGMEKSLLTTLSMRNGEVCSLRNESFKPKVEDYDACFGRGVQGVSE